MVILYGKNNRNIRKVVDMEEESDVINVKGILEIYKEDCEEDGETFKKKEFNAFWHYLEIDFYDWVSGNLRQFNLDKSFKDTKNK